MTSMKVQCQDIALSEIRNLRSIEEYNRIVRPLSYDFALERGAEYAVIGVWTQSGTPWLYVKAVTEDSGVQVVPAVLFRFDWKDIPSDWRIRITPNGDILLLPTPLAAIEGWFEKYVDGDSRIIGIVNRELNCFG